MFNARVCPVRVDYRTDTVDGGAVRSLRASHSELAFCTTSMKFYLSCVAKLLGQRISGRAQLVDVHIDHFPWRKDIAAMTENIVHTTGKLFFIFLWLLSGISKIMYRLCNFLCLRIAGQQILHYFERTGDFFLCRCCHGGDSDALATGKLFQE